MTKKKILWSVFAWVVIPFLFNLSEAKERRAEVTFKINLNAPENSKDVRIWIPFAVSDENQAIEDVRIIGNYSSHGIYKEPEFGNSIFYAEWKNRTKDRSLNYTFTVKEEGGS